MKKPNYLILDQQDGTHITLELSLDYYILLGSLYKNSVCYCLLTKDSAKKIANKLLKMSKYIEHTSKPKTSLKKKRKTS